MQPYFAKILCPNAPDDRGRQTPGKLLMATHAIADNKASRLGSSRRLFQG